MKFLLLLLVVLVVVWTMRGNTRRRAAPPPPAAAPGAEDMVACAQCGVHLPRSEALPGRGGVFCGEAHRLVFERDHARP